MVVADRAAGQHPTSGTQIATANGTRTGHPSTSTRTPTILKDGSIRLQFGLEYQPRPPHEPRAQQTSCRRRMSQINERLR